MTRLFEPPYADTVPPVYLNGPNDRMYPVDPLAQRLMRHYKSRARGQSVLKIGGTYRTVPYPTQDELSSASEVYLGGHVYTVSDAIGDALEAAGYSTTEFVPPVGVEGYEWRDLEGLTWDEFAEQRAWA